MTVRIVRDEEVREALRGSENLAKGREYVLAELEHLRGWLAWKAGEDTTEYYGFDNEEFIEALKLDGLRYPIELLEEIQREIEKSWLKPVTREDLGVNGAESGR